MEGNLKKWFGLLLVAVVVFIVVSSVSEAARKKSKRAQPTETQRIQLQALNEVAAFLRTIDGPGQWRRDRIKQANRKLKPKEQNLYDRANGRIAFVLSVMKGYGSLFPVFESGKEREKETPESFARRRQLAIDFPKLIAPAISADFRRNWEKKDNRLDVLEQLSDNNLGAMFTNGRLDLSKCGERNFDFKKGKNRISLCSVEATCSVFFDCDRQGKINNIGFEHYAVD